MANVEKTVMFAMPNVVSGQLACVSGTAAGRSWDLSAGTFVIGRLDENDLALPQEPGVSKVHAKIIGQVDRYVLVDCESRNGTLLNGQLVQRADIYDGDEIRICGCTLRFTQKGGPNRPRPKEAVAPVVEAPRAPEGPPTQAMAVPQFAPPPVTTTAVSMPPPAAPSTGRTLAKWYAGGVTAALLLGGAASAALVVATPTPVVAPTPPIATGPTTPTTPTTPPPTTPPPTEPAPATPPPTEPTPTTPPPTEPTPTTPPPTEPTPTEPTPTEPTPTEPTEPEAPPEPTEPKKPPKKRPTSTTTSTAPTEAAPTEAAPSTAEAQQYPAVVDGGKSESLKTRTGGRVKSVDAKDGDMVAKGQVLVTFDSGADPGEIATLEDRIASLENADDEEAKRELKAAKQKLAALEGGAKAQPIVAGMDGKLSGFGVSVGNVLRAGETVGKIGDGDVPARVRITVARGKVRKGQTVQLVLKGGGAAEGTVLSVNGKTVVVDTGAEPGDAVDAVKF